MNEHLREWLAKTPADRREAVAAAAGTTIAYLWQLSGGHRKATPEIAARLQDASDGDITIAGLRPDLVPIAIKTLEGQSKAKQPPKTAS